VFTIVMLAVAVVLLVGLWKVFENVPTVTWVTLQSGHMGDTL
jgi:hypothetical protein